MFTWKVEKFDIEHLGHIFNEISKVFNLICHVLAGFILFLAGKMAISGCLAVMYIYTAELFPTQVRANAVGLCSMIEQFGGIISPVFLHIHDIYSWLPGTVFGLTSIVAGLMSLYLPETYNLQMMMSFEDASSMYRDVSRRSWLFNRGQNKKDTKSILGKLEEEGNSKIRV